MRWCPDCEMYHDAYVSCETIDELRAAARGVADEQLTLDDDPDPIVLCVECGAEFEFSKLDERNRCADCVANDEKADEVTRQLAESLDLPKVLKLHGTNVENGVELCGHILGFNEHFRHGPERWCGSCRRWVGVRLEALQ